MNNNNLPQYTLGWKGSVLLISGGFLPIIIVSIVSAISLLVFKKDLEYNVFLMMFSNALMWCGAIFAFDYLSCRPETRQKLRFNFSSQSISVYAIIFKMMLGMMFVAEGVTSLIPVSGPVFGDLYEYYSQAMANMTKDTYSLIILTVIMAPIFEEIVFRGIIMKGMINGGTRPAKAIFISAVVFGLVHGNPWQFVGAILLGSVLGYVYLKTQSLLMSILLHAFNNLCSVLLITYTDVESFAEAFKIPEYTIVIIGAILFSISFLIFRKLKLKEN